MSRKSKAQASSARAASGLASSFGSGLVFQSSLSPLSYVTESPDLSQISEPNVVVAFKNLSKKDSTTKAKALEELLEIYQTGLEVEQPVLAAWSDVFPRTSIDNARRVRQLAFSVLGVFAALAGKKIAPLLPKLAGAWLAGSFDADKIVARSAHDALHKVFTSPDKIKALWKMYRESLIEYVKDAITVQTKTTLSDERTTSPDDAEAKYVRVVSTAMSVLAVLVRDGQPDDQISKILSEKQVWEFAFYNDPSLRRATSGLVVEASRNYFNHLDWSVISSCFLYKGLQSSQAGSSLQFLDALILFGEVRPEVWSSDYTSKKPVVKRLYHFLQQGSQYGSERVWSKIQSLVKSIPSRVLFGSDRYSDSVSLIQAIRTGVLQPSERGHALAAWSTYIEIASWLMSHLETRKNEFAMEHLAPLVIQHITKTEDQQWALQQQSQNLCKQVLERLVNQGCYAAFDQMWAKITGQTIEMMKISLPQSSGDFRASQDAVAAQAKRLFSFRKEVLKVATESPEVTSVLYRSQIQLLEFATDLLRSRKGKPYGAATVINCIVEQPDFDKKGIVLQNFTDEDVVELAQSPSAEIIASIALRCGDLAILNGILQVPSANTSNVLNHILSCAKDENLGTVLEEHVNVQLASLEKISSQQMATVVMSNPVLVSLHKVITGIVIDALSAPGSSDARDGALHILDSYLSSTHQAPAISDEDRATVLSRLLSLSDGSEEAATKAMILVQKLTAMSPSTVSSETIIQRQLDGAEAPLAIYTLLDLATTLVMSKDIDVNAIMPTEVQWNKALSSHLKASRPYEFAITNALQGAVYGVPQNHDAIEHEQRDTDDFSLAFRLTFYAVKQAQVPTLIDRLDKSHLESLQYNLPLALQLVNDKLTIETANGLWMMSTPEVLQEAAEILAMGNELIRSWLTDESFVSNWLSKVLTLVEQSPTVYSQALTWTSVASQIVDRYGPSDLMHLVEQDLKSIHRSQQHTKSCAIICVLKEHLGSTVSGKKIINELVARATDAKADVTVITMLNVVLNEQPEVLETLPVQRIVFLLKNLLDICDHRKEAGIVQESFKLLSAILPLASDIYGEHWDRLMSKLIQIWGGDMDMPLLNATLRLYARLRSLLSAEDTNEDLQESWKKSESVLSVGLVNCLQFFHEPQLVIDQPRDITADMLRRQLAEINLSVDTDIYNLLTSPIAAVQASAFDLLHRAIPKRQEQLSLDLVLEKKTTHLPEIAMKLIGEASDTRQSLLTWCVVFDHFSTASFKLREIYSADIKSSGHLHILLDSICHIIRITDQRPVDASKFEFQQFRLATADTTEKEVCWLAIHIYYSCLLYLPGVTKDWFFAQKNRIKIPLESWTVKYISGSIISGALSSVRTWADSQSEDDDRPLEIKTNPHGSEVVASIAIDPENPPISIAISLPANYPLESPAVTSRARVGVSEKNWMSWLRTFQIIIFSTGSIVEGLIAFRRNVQGALKGQNECAICYSIIGTDMQTPNKKCGTCKNTFHGSCLFRWFKSSNSSSCPLCRNNFNYA